MRPHYELVHADLIAYLKHRRGAPFDGFFSDPPYHLTPIVKRFGGANSAPAKPGKDGLYQRISRGFMRQTWDGGDLAFRPSTWALVKKHLRAGALGAMYASQRGWAKVAAALDEAGLEFLRVIVWLRGNAYPKATRLDAQIGEAKSAATLPAAESAGPAHDWIGYRYGLQSLRPVAEPIIFFRNGSAKWSETAEKNIEQAPAWFYHPKASTSERERGLDRLPAQAANRRNHHPTIKPISLNREIARLILAAPNTRLLAPFSGTGSEMIGGILGGWSHVTGIESEAAYLSLAEGRLRYWLVEPSPDTLLERMEAEAESEKNGFARQLRMF